MTAKKVIPPRLVDDPEEIWVAVCGSIDLGVIGAEVATILKCVPGPIRLPVGNKWYGRDHIQANDRRMAQIKGLGFPTATDFVAETVGNWSEVLAANESNRLVLVAARSGYGLRVVVQRHHRNGRLCWSVVTAVPGRKAQQKEVLYSKVKKEKTDG